MRSGTFTLQRNCRQASRRVPVKWITNREKTKMAFSRLILQRYFGEAVLRFWFPPPLRGRVRVGGDSIADCTPHPNPPPQGGREQVVARLAVASAQDNEVAP